MDVTSTLYAIFIGILLGIAYVLRTMVVMNVRVERIMKKLGIKVKE